ncbi:MAG: DUF4914 family protein, partial [Chitinivibrionales bacterium]
MKKNDEVKNLRLPEYVSQILDKAPVVRWAHAINDLYELSMGDGKESVWNVNYTLPDDTVVTEAQVVKTKNGISANYLEPYMRRRDPECMVVADDRPSDKKRFDDRFGYPFSDLRVETFDWLAQQELAMFAFETGQGGMGGDALAICPANAAFFAFGLGLLQGVVDVRKLDREFKPEVIIYVAPPFRHTHFEGKQIVAHNRVDVHEIFAYNLYPGPSAKKGVYGALINKGAKEGWVTAHCSAVQVMTPYDNIVTFMHEGASGGGKSEMLQQPHRMPDGRLLLGKNLETSEERFVEITRTCDLYPVCDDMGLCHPDLQEKNGKLWIMDAENAWFVRVDHITSYGTDHDLESLTVEPSVPLLFLNLDAVSGATALIWEHIEDEPGVRCPNPRVVLPRKIVPGVIDEKTHIDIRSFGVRTPPCTKEKPSYGIIGLFHVLPPALAWLWRLVAPRGYSNPSIVDTGMMSSEGVGSYWPFATGKRVNQANLLLDQDRPEDALREYQIYLETFESPKGLADALHGKGWALYLLEDYTEAALAFRKALEAFPPGDLELEAIYKSADSYFKAGMYNDALDIYNMGISMYPNSDQHPEMLFQSAETLRRLDRIDDAIERLAEIEKLYPSSDMARKAAIKTARIEEGRREWDRAIAVYTEMAERYAETELALEALHNRAIIYYRL